MRPVDADEILKKQKDLIRRTCDEVYANDWHDPVILAMSSVAGIVLDAPTIEVVKQADIHHIKYLWRSEAWYLVQDVHKCGNCGKDVDEWGQNFCSKCGAKLDGEHKYFRKKTIFVEGEDTIVPISHAEYKRAEEWEYEID